MAQRWQGGLPGRPVGPGFILAHLSLFVTGDLREATQAVNRFLEEAGAPAEFDPQAVTTVEEVRGPGGSATLAEVRKVLVRLLSAPLCSHPGTPPAIEDGGQCPSPGG